jgi:L-lysine 6-transaminase
MTAHTRGVTPDGAIPVLKKHMLVDGFDIVVDLRESRGSYIVDARTGRRYLDFFTFVASSPVGLNHPKMTRPEFLEKLAAAAINKPSNSDIYTIEQAEFLETFERVALPSYLPHVFFVDGGTLGVENALKAAFDWKVKKNFRKGYKEEKGTKILHFRKAFHGRSGYTLSLTNTDPAKTDLYPKFAWPRVLNPAQRFPLTDENVKATIADEETSIAQAKTAFREHKDDIAAIIIEPIQGEGGDNHFRGEFLRMLKRLADENEALFIVDEVQTGIALTGKMWAHQHFAFEPDMVAFGKKMQVCGFLCGKRIDEVEDNVFVVPSRINSTWGGNLVDMVRAQRYLEIIEEENLVENARSMGEYLVGQLGQLATDFPKQVTAARGRGLFAAFDMVDMGQRTPFREKCLDQGLILLPSGERSIRFRPPLTVSREEIDEGIRVIRTAIENLA